MRTNWRMHKIVGYAWMLAMLGLCITGLMILSYGLAVIGHFGPIHLFCFAGLAGIFNGINLARKRRIAEHRMTLKWTWFGAMGAASLANFIPGRTMNEVFFTQSPDAGWAVIAFGTVALITLWQRDRGQMMRYA
jgi:uncharacterized membrane protein